jgi:chromate reductase
LKIAAIAGSLRRGSFNKMALRYIVDGAKEAGAEVETLDLKEYNFPAFDGDIEAEGLPEKVVEFKSKIEGSDGLIIVTPEYNHSIPGGLKNAIDWASRQGNPFRDKLVVIAGASTSSWGTTRSQIAILPVLRTLRMFVLPSQLYIPKAEAEFDDQGNVKDKKLKERLMDLGKELVETIRNFKN